MDPVLVGERRHARKLIREFNDAPAEDEEGRKSILKKLLNPNSAPDVFIEPTFRCDYGYNITIGSNAQINFDFCILDCAPVTIGSLNSRRL